MILNALYDYYHRSGEKTPFGFTKKEIPFIVVLDEEGNFLRVEDRRIDNTQTFFVVDNNPTYNIKPSLMYGKLSYTFGVSETKSTKSKNATRERQEHEAFIAKCKTLADTYRDVKVFNAVVAFYEKGGVDAIKQDSLWPEMLNQTGANVSFMLQGETEIAASASCLASEADKEEWRIGRCLVTGEEGPLVRIFSKVQVPGELTKAALVSFQKKSGYDSYGKTQCENAPISRRAEGAITNALKTLLGKGSRNKHPVGTRTFLFWASGTDETAKTVEECICNLCGVASDKSENDDPNRRIEEVRKTFKAIKTGKLPSDSKDRFYLLGLTNNKTRWVVVYWREITFHDLSACILRHFDDMEVVDRRQEPVPYCGLRQMMKAVTLKGKDGDVQPNLPEATIRSIMQGLPYPATLYAAALRRIRAEQDEPMRIGRIAIIKAYINRKYNEKN